MHPDDPSALDPATLGTLDYRPVWQHARAFAGDAYADWYCHTYLGHADPPCCPEDLPDHEFAWQWFPGEAARGQLDDDGEPFTPAEIEPRGPCWRCGSAWQPAGAWHFDWGDGHCMRDIVCPGCGLQSYERGAWDPPEQPEPDDDTDQWAASGTMDAWPAGWDHDEAAGSVAGPGYNLEVDNPADPAT